MANPSLLQQVLARLKSLSNPRAVEGMARFGIRARNPLGISVPALRKISREFGPNHRLAQELWESGYHEARILAALVAEPEKVTERQMELWVRAFDSWDICDACCANLFDRTRWAYRKAAEWTGREGEFVKRAGFALMAALAAHDSKARDSMFIRLLPLIRRESQDERNFVKKAVNWALRQIGKRNSKLNRAAIQTARQIRQSNCRAARWIAADALRELTSESVERRVRRERKRPGRV